MNKGILHYKHYLLTVILLSSVFLCYAQNISFESSNIKVINNKGSASLDKILFIDDDGFLWYSTNKGIVKEMGSERILFKYNLPDKQTPSFMSHDVFKTKAGKIWTCTAIGANILDPQTGVSKWIEVETNHEDDEKTTFTTHFEDSKGNIWLGTTGSYIYCYTTDEELIPYKVIPEEEIKLKERLEHMHFSDKLTADKFIVYKDGFTYIFNQNKLIPLFEDNTKKIFSNGELFPKNKSGHYTYNKEKYFYKYIDSLNVHIGEVPFKNKFSIKKQGDRFNITTINENKIEIYELTHRKNKIELLKRAVYSCKKEIVYFKLDNDNNIFFYTNEGITKLRYVRNNFYKELTTSKRKDLKTEISCRSIVEDKEKNLYILTYDGIYTRQRKGKNYWRPLNYLIDDKIHNYIKSKYIGMTMYNDDKELLLYGYTDSFMYINTNTGNVKEIKFVKNFSIINDLEIITPEKWLIGTRRGMYYFNKTSNKFSKIEHLNYKINEIVLAKNKKEYLIGTANNGLFITDLNLNIKANYNSDSETNILVNNHVKAIFEDSNNLLWIGTMSGLQSINRKTNKSKFFTTETGLINDNIVAIQQGKWNIWAGSFNGLIKINKNTKHFNTFFEEDGIPHNEFNFKASFKNSDSTIYFGGLNGLVKFKNQGAINHKQKHLSLVSYTAYNTEEKQNLTVNNLTDKINTFSIYPNNNYLILKFAINDLTYPDKNLYRYKIKEINNDWVEMGNYNTIQINGLTPDEYTLHVQGITYNGYQTPIKTYKVIVNQVLYKKPWFIIFCICAFLTMVIISYSIRTRQTKIFYYQKNKINKLEAKAMRAQMNPHFIFNTLNGMQSVMILKGEREANKYFTAFSKLIRLTLDMSNSELISLQDEITYINSYLKLENLRLDEKLNYYVKIDEDIDLENTKIPGMMLQPHIENAIIHGLVPKKEDLDLCICFKLINDHIRIEIKDNGIGRSASAKIKNKKHKSWATEIMTERINLTNKLNELQIHLEIIDLKDENGKASGTKVHLYIPLSINKSNSTI